MIEFHEIVKDVWVFPSAGDGHNCAVVMGERGALLVDPGGHEMDRRAVGRFLDEHGQGAGARVVVFTVGRPDDESAGWPDDAHVMGRGVPQNGVSLPDLVPGWEILTLGEAGGGRVGVYHAGLKVLFCGDMLADPKTGIPRLAGDSQGYLDALAQVEALSVKLAVPLRGAPASGKRAIRARIEGDRNYIHSLLRHVLSTQAAQLPLERALTVASEIYESFPYLDDHLANMRAVWGEIG